MFFDIIVLFPDVFFFLLAGSSRASTGLNYKTHAGSSKYKFGILAKVVQHMKVSDYYP